ncbi:MAG TPA: TetR/AcrR family transcriptional regulator [Jatrophihabitantaceae bacterium]|jgi:AcrR family transcriptional regulator
MVKESRARYVRRAATDKPVLDRNRKPGGERWAELLETSAKIFAAKGYAATSLQDIAEELQILKGSLYYYIDSKEDLLYEVIRDVLVKAHDHLSELALLEGTGAERLERVIHAHVEYLLDHLTATTVYLHEITRLDHARRKSLPSHNFVSMIAELLQAGQEDGSIRKDIDVEIWTLSILGTANWVYRWYTPGRSPSKEKVASEIAAFNRAALERVTATRSASSAAVRSRTKPVAATKARPSRPKAS